MNLKEFINSENFFKKDFSSVKFKTNIETIEKIFKKFYDKDFLDKKIFLQNKLSEVSGLNNSDLTKYELIKSKFDYINNRNQEQKKLEKLRLESNNSLDNLRKYQKFLEEIKFNQEIEISEKEKKEFEALEIKLKNRESKIFSEIDFEPLENIVNLLYIKGEFELNFRNKKEKTIYDSIFSFLEKEELFDLLEDLSNFNLVKTDNGKFKSLITNFNFSYNDLYKLLYDFILVVIYYEKVEEFDFKDINLEEIKEIENKFGGISTETKEKNRIIINNFFDSIFKNLKKEENIKKIILLKDFCKNFSFDLNFEEELKEIEKEISIKNNRKKINYTRGNRIHNILFSKYQNYQNLFEFNLGEIRLLNVDLSFVPLVKLFVNLGIFEKKSFIFKIKKGFDLKKGFFTELLTNISEIIYKKFEEELPGPLLENGIGLIGRFKDGKRKNFSLINSFGIEFNKFEEFKENLLDKGYIFIEKNSLGNSKDIFLFVKENSKNANENVIFTQLIKKFEEDLIKSNDFKNREFKKEKVDKKSEILKKAIEEIQQRQEIIEKQEFQEENFGNVSNINETFGGRIFYGIDEEKEFFRIDEESLSEAYNKVEFFTYVFTQEEHRILDYKFDIAILYDKQVHKKDLLLYFLKYLSVKENKDLLLENSSFFYSKIIGTTGEQKYQELRKFFKPYGNYLILKTQQLMNQSTRKVEVKYIGGFNYDELLQKFDLSIQQFGEFLTSDEGQNIGRYNIYKKKQNRTSGVSYIIFSRRYIQNMKEYTSFISDINKKHQLGIEGIS